MPVSRAHLSPFAIALVALAFSGCPRSHTRPDDRDLIAVEGFSHAAHLADTPALREGNGGKALTCGDCHATLPEQGFQVQRPGTAAHAPCDTCHEQAFYEPPGALCTVCHTQVDPFRPDASPLGEYPRRARNAELVGAFNHALHLDGAKVQPEGGGQLKCTSCHGVKPDDAYAAFPTHANCAPCHAPPAAKAKPALDDCAGCHEQDGPGRARTFAKNDIRFTHGKHLFDARNEEIRCLTCHEGITTSTSSADRSLPGMATCAQCHEDSARTPDSVRIAKCGVCHTDDVEKVNLPGNHTAGLWPRDLSPPSAMLAAGPGGQGVASDAPGLLAGLLQAAPAVLLASPPALTPTERAPNPNVKPEDHTLLFRRRHEAAARAQDAKCGYCHSGISNSPRDSCQDCHAVMRPKDHTLRFRNIAHGRDAARDPQRCATCHEVDQCTACHKQRPPSHGPNFETRHDRAARFNPRACMTCHSFEATCVDCHRGTIARDPFSTFPNQLRRR